MAQTESGVECSFCGVRPKEESVLTLGNSGLTICSACVTKPNQKPSNASSTLCPVCRKQQYYFRESNHLPGLTVCESCIAELKEQLSNPARKEPERQCSFCLKSESAVEKMIGKPGAFICNECVMQFSQRLD